jgi:hypothetical protein
MTTLVSGGIDVLKGSNEELSAEESGEVLETVGKKTNE